MIGLHLPNSPLSDDDLKRIDALNVRDVVDLDLFADRWPSLVKRWPGVRIHARIYKRGWPADPEAEARYLCDLADQHPEVATWRCRNEPNIESPGCTPSDWRWYLTAFGQAVRARRPDIQLYTPAIAPWWVGWRDWVEATLAVTSATIGLYAGRDAHAYGTLAEVADILWQVQSDRQDVLVTELNFGAGRDVDLRDYAASLPDITEECLLRARVQAVCYFIWHWQNPDMELPTSLDVRGTPIEAAIARINGSGGGDEMVQIDDAQLQAMVSQSPSLWQAWVAAGGVRDNFRRFLLGQGQLPITDDALRFLAGQAQAAANEQVLAVNKRFPR